MSSSVSTATPSRPTSPAARGSSLSRPMSVGRSNAVERPVCPFSSRNLNRSFVCRGVPNPANCRIVQRRPRYMLACTPRVNGYWPGYRSSGSPLRPFTSSGVYSGSIGRPLTVVGGCSRTGDLASSSAQRSLSTRSVPSDRLMLESLQTNTQVVRIGLAQRMDSPAFLRNGEPRGLGLPDAAHPPQLSRLMAYYHRGEPARHARQKKTRMAKVAGGTAAPTLRDSWLGHGGSGAAFVATRAALPSRHAALASATHNPAARPGLPPDAAGSPGLEITLAEPITTNPGEARRRPLARRRDSDGCRRRAPDRCSSAAGPTTGNTRTIPAGSSWSLSGSASGHP